MKQKYPDPKEKAIICFEGPSSVGKTTMCHLLSEVYNIVPEVNLLFKRSADEPPYWYYEKQLERYALCRKANRSSILDGDIFQPIWYNWACGYPSNFLGKKETHDFYTLKIMEGQIAFPDLYIIFEADEKELRKRKENDPIRRRRNFEKHLKIIAPLKPYYRFLEKETPIEMRFVQYDDIDFTKKQVLNILKNTPRKPIDDAMVFDQIVDWINRNKK